MIWITKRRMFLASLASAIAFFVLPAVGLLVGWMQMPFLNPDGTPDNAPVRGAAVFVLFSPALFVLLVAITFCGALLLQHFRQLKPRALVNIVAITGFGLGVVMVLDQDRKSTRLNSSHSQISYAVF